jgi:hypothetical protein
MELLVAKLLDDFEHGKMTRRQLVQSWRWLRIRIRS